jgi:GDP-L-fucose synthase
MNKESKIYVAGHRGLVGSAIVNALQEKGYNNIVYRRHDELDLTDQVATTNFFNQEKPDYVFLAAAKVGGIVANNRYRGEFLYQNLSIQNNIIHQSYLHKVKKLLFLGSTCIYPKASPQPIREEYLLTDTLEYTNEPYAIAKIAGIKMCESYNLQYDTNFISVMPTNLYGINDNFNLETSHVLPALIRKIHLGKALENNDWETIKKDLSLRPIEGVTNLSSQSDIIQMLHKYGINRTQNEAQDVSVDVWGTGTPRREFLWSQDMANACVFIMENRDFSDTIDSNTQEVRNTHINIGTGVDISISDLAELIRNTIGFNGRIIFDPSKPDGVMKKLTDCSKLNNLGWKHSVELRDGIKKIYLWYKSQ